MTARAPVLFAAFAVISAAASVRGASAQIEFRAQAVPTIPALPSAAAISPLAMEAPAPALAPNALSSLEAAAGAVAVAASAGDESTPLASEAAATQPEPTAPVKFSYENEGVRRVDGIYDQSGKPLDRYFHVSESKIRDGNTVTLMASAFNQEFDMIARQECAAVGGSPATTAPANARQTADMEADTFFNPFVWGWRVSLERYFRCENAAGDLIPAAR